MFSSFFSSFSFFYFYLFLFFCQPLLLLFYFIVSFCHLFALLCFPVIFYLQDFPIPDMEYTIRISCQMIVMCYHDQCLLLLSDYPLHQFHHFFRGMRVQISGWLIGKYNIRIDTSALLRRLSAAVLPTSGSADASYAFQASPDLTLHWPFSS